MALTEEQKLAKHINELSSDILSIGKKLASIQASLLGKKDALERAKKALEKIQKPKTPPVVSEHAQLQYLARITGIDMEMIKDAILPKDKALAIAEKGPGSHDLGTHTVVLQGNTIVTVY